MDQLIKMFEMGESITPVISIWSVIIGCTLSALLSILIGFNYRRVHSEPGYSQSLVHTFVLISMITTLIMIIIGSNIARAFSLVGALSIIRFRTAIKSPLDVAFVFLSISIGMACGTGFYAVAIIGFAIIISVILILNFTNFGSSPSISEYLLSVTFHIDVNYEKTLAPILQKYFEAYNFAYAETVRQGTLREVVYSLRPKPKVEDQKVVDAIAEVNDNLKISYRKIRHAVDIP